MEQKATVSQAEMEILRYVTEHQPVSVREVTEHFQDTSGWARTTVLTLMERLREKGYLTRRKVSGVNHYSPAAAQADMLSSLVRNFVQKVLGGSVAPFMTYLGKDAVVSDAELAELKRVVEQLEAQRKEERE